MFIYRPTRKKPNALSLTSEHKQDIEQMMARGYTIYNMAKVINRSESLVRKYIRTLAALPDKIITWNESLVVPFIKPRR